MDRYEVAVKVEEIIKNAQTRQYDKACEILQTINTDKIKNYDDLITFAEVYLKNKKYIEAKAILERLHERTVTRRVIALLISVTAKMHNYVEAERYYEEYVEMAPKDVNRFILRYKIDKAKGLNYDVLIKSLEQLKEFDLIEEWEYELAKLYHKAGYYDKCISECNTIIMMFGAGVTVEKAKMLRDHHIDAISKNPKIGTDEQIGGDTDFNATVELNHIIDQVKEKMAEEENEEAKEIENIEIESSDEEDYGEDMSISAKIEEEYAKDNDKITDEFLENEKKSIESENEDDFFSDLTNLFSSEVDKIFEETKQEALDANKKALNNVETSQKDNVTVIQVNESETKEDDLEESQQNSALSEEDNDEYYEEDDDEYDLFDDEEEGEEDNKRERRFADINPFKEVFVKKKDEPFKRREERFEFMFDDEEEDENLREFEEIIRREEERKAALREAEKVDEEMTHVITDKKLAREKNSLDDQTEAMMSATLNLEDVKKAGKVLSQLESKSAVKKTIASIEEDLANSEDRDNGQISLFDLTLNVPARDSDDEIFNMNLAYGFYGNEVNEDKKTDEKSQKISDEISEIELSEEAPEIEIAQTEEEAPEVEIAQTEEEAPEVETAQTEEEAPEVEIAQTEEEAPEVEIAQTEEEAPEVEIAQTEEEAPEIEMEQMEEETPEIEMEQMEEETADTMEMENVQIQAQADEITEYDYVENDNNDNKANEDSFRQFSKSFDMELAEQMPIIPDYNNSGMGSEVLDEEELEHVMQWLKVLMSPIMYDASKTEDIDQKIFRNYYDISFLRNNIRCAMDTLAKSQVKGNFIICGQEKSGRTTIAKMIAKTAYTKDYIETSKIARIDAEKFNEVDLEYKKDKLADGCLIIQKAHLLTPAAMTSLITMIIHLNGRIIVFLETDYDNIANLYILTREVREYFSNVISLPEYNSNELMGFAKSYAAYKNYSFNQAGQFAMEELIGKTYEQLTPERRIPFVLTAVEKSIRAAINRSKGGFGKPNSDGLNELDAVDVEQQFQ